jgi:cob(I)alamin adenosyltransferase
MRIYTKTGDDGTTGLLYGGRVDKHDLRTEAYGTVDETVAALGLARADLTGPDDAEWHDTVLALQRELFVVGAQLATHPDHWRQLHDGVSRVTPAMVERLEEAIDALTERYPLPAEFIVPGGRSPGAALDLARATVRRAERAAVAMHRREMLPDDVLVRYLNRCSDYLFVLARAVEGGTWVPSRERASDGGD